MDGSCAAPALGLEEKSGPDTFVTVLTQLMVADTVVYAAD